MTVAENLQPLAYAVATIIFVITFISTLLRFYARMYIVKEFGWDDWVMVSIFFWNIGQQCFLYLFLHYGGGLHAEVVSPENLALLPKMLFGEEIYYIWMHFIIKMCFLLFYLRLSQVPSFKRMVYGAMAINTAFTISIWLLYCLQCFPLAAFWDPLAHPNAKCLDVLVTYFVPASLCITTDFIILILPIKTLWTLQVSLRRKISLMAVVGFGACSVLVSVLRLIVLWQFYSNPDFTYTLGKMVIISSLEIEVAILAANVPSLRSFWLHYVSKQEFSKSGSGNSHSLEELGNKSSVSRSKSRGLEEGVVKKTDIDATSNTSEEQLFDGKHNIKVTSSVGMSWSESPSMPKSLMNKSYYQFDE